MRAVASSVAVALLLAAPRARAQLQEPDSAFTDAPPLARRLHVAMDYRGVPGCADPDFFEHALRLRVIQWDPLAPYDPWPLKVRVTHYPGTRWFQGTAELREPGGKVYRVHRTVGRLRCADAIARLALRVAADAVTLGGPRRRRPSRSRRRLAVHDIEVSGVLVLAAVGLAIVLYYRSLRAIPLLCGPLFTGTVLAFAAGRVAIGYLNPNTAFLGSIIIGNGINAGIVLLARYLEERRGGVAVADALPRALTTTWRATLTASGGAAASYACLGVAGFRGFNQFAFIGGVGMVLVWISTYLLMPPLLVVFERRSPLARRARPEGVVAGPYARLLAGRAWPIALACGALALVSAATIARFAADPIEYDFTHLGSRQGAVDGSIYWAKHADAVIQSYLTPTVIRRTPSTRRWSRGR